MLQFLLTDKHRLGIASKFLHLIVGDLYGVLLYDFILFQMNISSLPGLEQPI